MTRKEIYAEVKKYNLEKTIFNEYGDHYTRVPNVVLLDYVRIAKDDAKKTVKVAKPSKETCNYKTAFVELVKHLVSNRVISNAKGNEILSLLN